MTQNFAGPGIPLPYPTADYPGYPKISNVPNTHATNFFDLAPGATYQIPRGTWSVYIGSENTLQILDPILNCYRGFATTQDASQVIVSDGTNWRVANLTGCAIGATITNAGTGYTSAPTVTASAGGSTWVANISGAISTTITVVAGGSGYTVPPLVVIPAPPAGGVPATAYAVLTDGAVTSYVVTTQGSGYTSAPPVILVPSPQDPNINNIVVGSATTALITAGTVTSIICTNPGATVATPATPVTLTITGGGGASAAATAIMCMTIASVTVSTAGTGYPDLVGALSFGGVAAASAIYRNAYVEDALISPPRTAKMTLVGSGGVIQQSGQIFESTGLFTATPLLQIGASYASVATGTGAVLTPTMGAGHSVFYLQPL